VIAFPIRYRGPVVVMLAVGLGLAAFCLLTGFPSADTDLYARAAGSPAEYVGLWGTNDQSWFVYPPPLLYVFRALELLGHGLVVVLWVTICAVAMGAGAGWWAVASIPFGILGLALNIFPLTVPLGVLIFGNVQCLILAGVGLGLRWPVFWALPLLTKVGPGIGMLWFLLRGEWRKLAMAGGATAVIAGVTFVIDPDLWFRWATFTLANVYGDAPVPVAGAAPLRFAAAFVLIGWGARTDRPWTVPIACGIASFALYEWSFLTIWLASLAMISRPLTAQDRDRLHRWMRMPAPSSATSVATSR
jgi:glycosyl transferase family 87